MRRRRYLKMTFHFRGTMKTASPEKNTIREKTSLVCHRCDSRMSYTGAPWNVSVCRCGLIVQYDGDGTVSIPNVAILICDLIRLIDEAGVVPCTKCGQRDTRESPVCRECMADVVKAEIAE